MNDLKPAMRDFLVRNRIHGLNPFICITPYTLTLLSFWGRVKENRKKITQNRKKVTIHWPAKATAKITTQK